MLIKIALTNPCPIDHAFYEKSQMVRLASGKVLIEAGSEKEKIIQAEIKKHPNALFFRAKAIKADEPNSNGDSFSKEELLKAYKTFEGVPFFTNHENQDIEKAKGKIIFAEWDEKENAVYTIAFVDRDAYPHICRGIEQGYMSGVSMGASVEYSVCNICSNKAERTEDYCSHIRDRKSRKFTGKARDVITGELKEFKDHPVFEHNYGIKFIELSGVVDPACPSCHIQGIIENNQYLAKVANIENSLRMVKTSALDKQASQQEIDQINNVLGTLEDLAVNLIKNRQQVEVEFASELVDIIANLQTWLDELVGAGYGNVQSNGEAGQTAGAPQEGVAPEGTLPEQVPAGPPQQPGVAPVSSQEAMSVGEMTGNTEKPLVNSPNMPVTAPIRPSASNFNSSIKTGELDNRIELGDSVLEKAASFCGKFNRTGVKNMGKRRTVASKEQQKQRAMEILSNSWQEKQNFFQYIKEVPSIQDDNLTLSVKSRGDSFIIVAEDQDSDRIQIWSYDDFSEYEKNLICESPEEAAQMFLSTFANNQNKLKEGVVRMSKEIKEAGANTVLSTPEVVTQAQLDQSGLYHGRTGDEKHMTTQKQLESLRSGESEVLTEKQLDDSNLKLNPRQGEAPTVVTQAQLPREDKDKHTVTQDQLDKEGYRTNKEPEVITQKQLDSVDAAWARQSSRDPKNFKTASEHMSAVANAFASVAIETGATPQEVQSVARELVANTKSRYNLANTIVLDPSEEKSVPFAQRVAFWNSKNVKIATASPAQVEALIVNKLKSIASDITVDPEVVVEAIDVISEGDEGVEMISERIDQQLASATRVSEAKTSLRSELRNAMKVASKEVKPEAKEEIKKEASVDAERIKRDQERKRILASINEPVKDEILNRAGLNGADTVIETSFDEVGTKKNSPSFRRDLVSFAKGALASNNMKLASVTNVTISGDTIQIAVQTDSGEESVNIPIGKGSEEPMDVAPEGDLSGEGAGNLDMGAPTGAPSTGTAARASARNKFKRMAQSPMGGGEPGAGAGMPAGANANAGMDAAPTGAEGDQALQSLTTDDAGMEGEDLGGEEIPTVGEKQFAWSICPECGSSDVDVTKDEKGGIVGDCNACGAGYEALVKKTVEFTIVRPTKSVGEEGEETPETPEAPAEMPALPVAAQTILNRNSMLRIAANKKANGDVCPSCGNTHCRVVASRNGYTKCHCDACDTGFSKNIILSSKNPSKGLLRVEWNLVPNTSCSECKKQALKLASSVKVKKLLRTASAQADSFPMASCLERVARMHGGNTEVVSSFGPCKGKPLANCVCKELQKLGFTKVRQMKKLAEVSMQEDPMDQCIKDQKKKGHDIVEAKSICNCIKKKFATKASDSIYVQAFLDDAKEGKIDLTEQDLYALTDVFAEKQARIEKMAQEILDNEEIGDALPPKDSVEIEVDDFDTIDETGEEEVVTVTITGKDIDVAVDNGATDDTDEDQLSEDVAFETEETGPEGDENMDMSNEELSQALAMSSNRVRRSGEESSIRLAGKPKQVGSIEKNVDSGVPRSKSTIRNEGPSNIDVPMSKPNVPRGKATMGHEGADNIDVPMGLPDVPVDSSYIGVEKSLQQGMPAINNEIKGTVIANDAKKLKEAKKLSEIDSVEKNVGGVPRGKATIGNEGSDNIDVPMSKPSVPRGNAAMGEEGADNIDVEMSGPDVPVGSGFMGHEKEVQKDMPAINSEILKNVQQKREQQLEKLSAARREEARNTAAWLAANGRIASDRATFDNVVTALSTFEVDKIASIADTMFPEKAVKTASLDNRQVRTAGLGTAIVINSQPEKEVSLGDKIARSFTVGSSLLNDSLNEKK